MWMTRSTLSYSNTNLDMIRSQDFYLFLEWIVKTLKNQYK